MRFLDIFSSSALLISIAAALPTAETNSGFRFDFFKQDVMGKLVSFYPCDQFKCLSAWDKTEKVGF
jgi:hypothetical protein